MAQALLPVRVRRGLVPRLFLCLALVACSAPQYSLRTAKIGLIAPLSGPSQGEGARWVQGARDAVREWNQTTLAGRPYRIELVIYDEAEGPAVARRLLVDPEVLGLVAPENSPLIAPLRDTRLTIRTVSAGGDVGAATRGLLETVAKAP